MLQITDTVIHDSDNVSCAITHLKLVRYTFWNGLRGKKGILKINGWTHDVSENRRLKIGTFARCHDVHENTVLCPSLTHDVDEY